MRVNYLFILVFSFCSLKSQDKGKGHYDKNPFKQLGQMLPTPNVYRTASGAPGSGYYQQRADYKMKITLDDKNTKLYGEQTITYYNNSPDDLEFLWVQLDQNIRAKNSLSPKIKSEKIRDFRTANDFKKRFYPDYEGGYNIDYVKLTNNKPLKYTINHTMMRIELKKPLRSGRRMSFKIKWNYNINNYIEYRGRSGYEPFKEDGNNLYVIAQFYPRMAVYNDVEGWQTLQFYGRSEFALPFGNFDVKITVPSDHILGATGKLTNEDDVLNDTQLKRLKKARKTFDKPVLIVTQDEAIEAEKGFSSKNKTWHFKAKNVRDFAFSTSRKFIWDAMAVKVNNKTVMAYSYYPKEGNPLWEQYSTRVTAHTLKTYSKYTFDYPYHKAISVHARWQGMEYPMICWNYGRPEKDGTYSKRVKYGMMSVIIHEIGHNYFPMIVNSDERQWGWMDEGLNTFLQNVTEQEWEVGYPSRASKARQIVPYMKSDQETITPIMTDSDNVKKYGPNCYSKPSVGLIILRETILGRKLFDYAFKIYANRWKFKHPTPADFFRTMEDASGVDLDWFWRGWFYTTNYCDIGIKNVKEYKVNSYNPKKEKDWKKSIDDKKPDIVTKNNKKNKHVYYIEKDKLALDFYNKNSKYDVTKEEERKYANLLNIADEDMKAAMMNEDYFYEIEFEKPGKLVMPIILEFVFENGETKREYLPAKIWRHNQKKVYKVFNFKNKVKRDKIRS